MPDVRKRESKVLDEDCTCHRPTDWRVAQLKVMTDKNNDID